MTGPDGAPVEQTQGPDLEAGLGGAVSATTTPDVSQDGLRAPASLTSADGGASVANSQRSSRRSSLAEQPRITSSWPTIQAEIFANFFSSLFAAAELAETRLLAPFEGLDLRGLVDESQREKEIPRFTPEALEQYIQFVDNYLQTGEGETQQAFDWRSKDTGEIQQVEVEITPTFDDKNPITHAEKLCAQTTRQLRASFSSAGMLREPETHNGAEAYKVNYGIRCSIWLHLVGIGNGAEPYYTNWYTYCCNLLSKASEAIRNTASDDASVSQLNQLMQTVQALTPFSRLVTACMQILGDSSSIKGLLMSSTDYSQLTTIFIWLKSELENLASARSTEIFKQDPDVQLAITQMQAHATCLDYFRQYEAIFHNKKLTPSQKMAQVFVLYNNILDANVPEHIDAFNQYLDQVGFREWLASIEKLEGSDSFVCTLSAARNAFNGGIGDIKAHVTYLSYILEYEHIVGNTQWDTEQKVIRVYELYDRVLQAGSAEHIRAFRKHLQDARFGTGSTALAQPSGKTQARATEAPTITQNTFFIEAQKCLQQDWAVEGANVEKFHSCVAALSYFRQYHDIQHDEKLNKVQKILRTFELYEKISREKNNAHHQISEHYLDITRFGTMLSDECLRFHGAPPTEDQPEDYNFYQTFKDYIAFRNTVGKVHTPKDLRQLATIAQAMRPRYYYILLNDVLGGVCRLEKRLSKGQTPPSELLFRRLIEENNVEQFFKDLEDICDEFDEQEVKDLYEQQSIKDEPTRATSVNLRCADIANFIILFKQLPPDVQQQFLKQLPQTTPTGEWPLFHIGPKFNIVHVTRTLQHNTEYSEQIHEAVLTIPAPSDAANLVENLNYLQQLVDTFSLFTEQLDATTMEVGPQERRSTVTRRSMDPQAFVHASNVALGRYFSFPGSLELLATVAKLPECREKIKTKHGLIFPLRVSTASASGAPETSRPQESETRRLGIYQARIAAALEGPGDAEFERLTTELQDRELYELYCPFAGQALGTLDTFIACFNRKTANQQVAFLDWLIYRTATEDEQVLFKVGDQYQVTRDSITIPMPSSTYELVSFLEYAQQLQAKLTQHVDLEFGEGFQIKSSDQQQQMPLPKDMQEFERNHAQLRLLQKTFDDFMAVSDTDIAQASTKLREILVTPGAFDAWVMLADMPSAQFGLASKLKKLEELAVSATEGSPEYNNLATYCRYFRVALHKAQGENTLFSGPIFEKQNSYFFADISETSPFIRDVLSKLKTPFKGKDSIPYDAVRELKQYRANHIAEGRWIPVLNNIVTFHWGKAYQAFKNTPFYRRHFSKEVSQLNTLIQSAKAEVKQYHFACADMAVFAAHSTDKAAAQPPNSTGGPQAPQTKASYQALLKITNDKCGQVLQHFSSHQKAKLMDCSDMFDHLFKQAKPKSRHNKWKSVKAIAQAEHTLQKRPQTR